MKQLVSAFGLLCGLLFFTVSGGGAGELSYRFPDLYNPNAVGGRLFLQPLGIHDDRVREGADISVSFGSATDYNVFFIERDGDPELTVNTNIWTLSASTGLSVGETVLELGGVFRAHQDMRETWGSNFVKNYHEFFSEGFGRVPPDGQYYGAVGNNHMPVIGKSREWFLNTLQLYAKHQLFRETDGPVDMAVKLSVRVPLSGKSFDTWGLGLSTGLSRQIAPGFRLIGSAGLVWQDLSEESFDADNLDVTAWAADVFGGLLWDMGRSGGWYAQAGVRWASRRVAYERNSDSAEPSIVTHFGPVYRFEEKRGRVLEWFLSCSEDIPGLGHGLEPDVGFYTGLALSVR
ncbi:hypothetical protein JCM14469_35020 [Desulfatiferula olefinivorans]